MLSNIRGQPSAGIEGAGPAAVSRRTGGAAWSLCSPQLGVERVAQPVAEQVEGEHGDEDHQPGKGHYPPRAQHELARVGEHRAPFGCRRLRAQAEAVGGVEGILLLDDIPGMLSPKLFDTLAAPYLARIFEAFDGLVRVYHNDTPCPHLLPRLAELPFEVFNFSHETDIADVRAAMPAHVLMGNVPPLDLGVRGTAEQVRATTLQALQDAGDHPLILSWGGATTIGAKPDNIRVMAEAVKEFNTRRSRSQSGFNR